MQKLDAVDAASLREDIPAFRSGDTVKVHVKVIEGNRSYPGFPGRRYRSPWPRCVRNLHRP